MNWQSIKDTFLKYWFIASALGLAILYMMLDRKGRQLSKALSDAQSSLLAEKLKQIKDQSQGSEEEYEKAKKEYEDLKRRHPNLLNPK